MALIVHFLQIFVICSYECYKCDVLHFIVLTVADDYENGPFMVQFNSNETVKTINVVIIQDALFEQNEIFEVTLQVQDEYQQLGIDIDSKMSTIRVTINNDDGMSVCCISLCI